MHCPQCGFDSCPGSHYCNRCGETFQQPQADAAPPARIPKFVWVGLTIIGLLALGFMVGIFAWMSRGSSRGRVVMTTVSGSIKAPAAAVPTASSAPSSPTSVEAQKPLTENSPEAANRERQRLKEYFRATIAAARPQLNLIGSEITDLNSGYALWAIHEDFSRDSFSRGDDAKIVSAWMAQNRIELQKANIVRVGLMGRGPSSSFCWLELK